jgi:cytosine/adenosine deaminase-related metal-dependent hydrolase
VTLLLRRARVPGRPELCDVLVDGDRVVSTSPSGGGVPVAAREIDLDGRALLPGFLNAHDVLDLAPVPPLGTPPYLSLYEWTADVEGAAAPPRMALAIPLPDRLFLGGMRNLLAGVTAAVHHGPDHRSLGRADFPVRVPRRYGFAPSPGQAPRLRRTYRTTDRRIPWFVRAAEGTDARSRAEVDLLAEAGVLRQNTVILHGTALGPGDFARLADARASVVWCPETDRRLYGATAPVRALVDAGVRVGLGSDSAAAGSRDLLSSLAAARRENVFGDGELLELATSRSAEVARLPVGGFETGAPADLLVTDDPALLLAGGRAAVLLVVRAGKPLYGTSAHMAAAGVAGHGIGIDGAERMLEASLFRRLRAILRSCPSSASVPWLAGVQLSGPASRSDAV